jgi:hypothetical protein
MTMPLSEKMGRVIALTLALVPPLFLARDDLYHHSPHASANMSLFA